MEQAARAFDQIAVTFGRSWCRLKRLSVLLGAGSCALALMVPLGVVRAQSAIERVDVPFALDAPVRTTFGQLPPDVAATLGALVVRMRGNSDDAATPPVTFASGLMGRVQETNFFYDGFGVSGIEISFMGAARVPEPGRRVFGTLQFADDLGRRATSLFGIEYTTYPDDIYVREVSVEPAAPSDPDVRLYLVPASDVAAADENAFATHMNFLAFLSDHALDGEGLPAQCECVIAAVSYDRLPWRASLFASVNTDGKKSVATGDHQILDFDGWRVDLFPATLDMSPSSNTSIEVLYAPPPSDGLPNPILNQVAKFSFGGEE